MRTVGRRWRPTVRLAMRCNLAYGAGAAATVAAAVLSADAGEAAPVIAAWMAVSSAVCTVGYSGPTSAVRDIAVLTSVMNDWIGG